MNNNLKLKIGHFTIWLMIITITLIAFWFIGFIISVTFDLNVFQEKTSEFLFLLIFAAFAIVICSSFLNISINISLIAESKINENDINSIKIFSKKLIAIVSGIILVFITLLFAGDQYSRMNTKNSLIDESRSIVNRFSNSLNDIAISIPDTSKIGELPSILKFLSKQKSDLPNITIITSGKVNDQLVFLQISRYSNKADLKEPLFNDSYFSCNDETYDYLESVFAEGRSQIHYWSEGSKFQLFYPILDYKTPYVLLFTEWTRYGDFGS